MKPLLLLLSAAIVCQAYDMRFRNLRTNRDGSLLYFITDARLTGTDQPFHGKIFAFSEKGIETVVSLPRIVTDAPDPPASAVFSMETSLDGEVIAYLPVRLCDDIQPCPVTAPGRSVIATRTGQVLWEGAGTVRLSADGRLALLAQPSGMFRLDVSALTRKLILSGFATGSIAPGGLALLQYGPPEFHLFREGQWDTFPARPGAILSPGGSTVVYSPRDSSAWFAKDLRTETEIPVPGEPIATSEDGTRILTRAFQQVSFRTEYRVFDTSTAKSYLIRGAEPILPEIILSPNGKIVFFTHAAGIFKADVESEATEPVLLQPLRLYPLPGGAVPGSLLTVNVENAYPYVSASAPPPLPTELAGFRLFIDGIPAPLLSVNITPGISSLQAQVPWETQSRSTVSIRIQSPQRTPFESLSGPSDEPGTVSTTFATRSPRFLYADASIFVQAVHQDLDRPITAADPARPGEVIHFFLTGLGPLNRPVPTGAAAPNEPPARPLQPLTCLGLPVLDTVLAPGMVGTYRATITVPSFAANALDLSCEGSYGIIPVIRP